MKKFLSIILTLSLLLGSFGSMPVAFAEENADVTEGNWKYVDIEGGVKITEHLGDEDDVIVPSTLGGKPVLTIGEYAFRHNYLQSVVIPEGVTTIECNAFYYCSRLTEIDLPESLVNLHSWAFAYGYIDNTNSHFWQDGILYVDDWVLRTDGCGANPVILEGAKKIASRAFCATGITESITLSSTISYMQTDAFESFRTEEFIVAEGNTHFKSVGGVLYAADGKELVKYPVQKESESYDISPFAETIRSHAFFECRELSSVTFPDSLKVIGDSAFESTWITSEITLNGIKEIGKRAFYQSSIRGVTFGGSLESVGDEAFYGTPLTAIDFPESVTYIGAGALGSCNDLATITVHDSNRYYNDDGIALFNDDYSRIIQFPLAADTTRYTLPERVKIIGGKAFETSSLSEVILSSGLTTIEYDAFKNCESLQEIELPDGVTTIGNGAFYQCYELRSVDFGESLKTIGDEAFYCCSSLGSVLLPDTAESIGSMAFQSCTSIETVDIGDNVSCLGAAAFRGCGSMKSIDLGNSVPEIKGGTFDHCLQLEALHITASVKLINEWAFYETTSLEEFTVDEDNPNYCAVDGVLFNKQKTRLINFPAGITDPEYTTPDGVSQIAQWAFACCQVARVNFSYSVNFIDDYAFETPKGITALYVYNPNCHFFSLSSLNGAITIYGYSGSTAETYASDNGYSFVALAEEEARDFEYVALSEDGTLRITKYNGEGGEVTVPETIDGVTVSCIGDMAFMGNTAITSISLPDSVYKIQTNAFRDCTALESITAQGVTILRSNAFYNCTSLAEINLGGGITDIGENAFRNCAITEFSWPAAVDTIERETFYGCEKLEEIIIPEGVVTIGSRAFDSTALSSVTIPSTVTTIMDYAFFFCEALSKINMGEGVTSIGVSAFMWTAHYCDPDNWEGGIYYLGKAALYHDYETLPQHAVVRAGTLLLADNSFDYNDNLLTLYIPESVIYFGERIFYNSDNASVKGVKGSRAEAFALASGLTFEEEVITCQHVWNEEEITAPTCTATGVKNLACSQCGETKTEPIAVIPHTEEKIPAVPPTCASYGVGEGSKCSVCGALIAIPQGIPPLPHTEVTVKGKAATCTATGLTDGSKCSECNTVIKAQTVIPTKPHTLDSGVVTKKATYDTTGVKTYKCTVCKKTVKTETIKKLAKTSLAKAKITVKDQTYSGKEKKPSITVKLGSKTLKKGTDYTVSYKNNKKIGKATVTIKGIKKYSGSVSKTFKINPKKVKSLKLKSSKKKQLTVSWKKDSKVTGYQIVYATNSKFTKGKKTVTVKSAKTVKKTIKSLKSKKTYYVKVRSYKTVSGKKYYSAYTSYKKLKVK